MKKNKNITKKLYKKIPLSHAVKVKCRIDSKQYVPMVPFKEEGTTLVSVLLDDNISPGEAMLFLHLTTIFPKRRFEGRTMVSQMFPSIYRSKVMLSRRFQALVNYGYLKIERVLQSESVYTLAKLTSIKED